MQSPESEVEKRERQACFLAHYRQIGNITKACELSGIGRRQTVYEWQVGVGGDAFAAQLQEARVQATEVLEEEARRRAVDGWDEPVYQRGVMVGTVKKYDSSLLSLLLQANAPEKYRQRVDVRAVQDLEIEDTLTPQQLAAFRAVMVAQLGDTGGGGDQGQAGQEGDIDAEYTTVTETAQD